MIVGGGVIGCEFACVYASVGVPVTVLEAMPEICPNLDSEIAAILRKELEKKGVTFQLVQKWRVLREVRSLITSMVRARNMDADLVLVATGRRPNVSGSWIRGNWLGF